LSNPTLYLPPATREEGGGVAGTEWGCSRVGLPLAHTHTKSGVAGGRYRVAKKHNMPYLCRVFSVKETYY